MTRTTLKPKIPSANEIAARLNNTSRGYKGAVGFLEARYLKTSSYSTGPFETPERSSMFISAWAKEADASSLGLEKAEGFTDPSAGTIGIWS